MQNVHWYLEYKQIKCHNFCFLQYFIATTLLSSPEFRPNTEEFIMRFDPKATKGQGPQRLKNLYFTYLVALRALAKAAPYLEEVRFKKKFFELSKQLLLFTFNITTFGL